MDRSDLERREFIIRRDGRACAYCGLLLERTDMTFDHVVPKAHGGDNGVNNLVLSCYECNQAKADSTVEDFRDRVLLSLVDQAVAILFRSPTCFWSP